MTPRDKLIIRSVSLLIVAFLVAWGAAGYAFDKAAAAAALTAILQAVVELLGPTSDAGVKWDPPTG